jgi:plasmid maintenance system antidote protein VapI
MKTGPGLSPGPVRFARFFETSSEFWLGQQSQYDLDVTADTLDERLEKEVRIYSKVA